MPERRRRSRSRSSSESPPRHRSSQRGSAGEDAGKRDRIRDPSERNGGSRDRQRGDHSDSPPRRGGSRDKGGARQTEDKERDTKRGSRQERDDRRGGPAGSSMRRNSRSRSPERVGGRSRSPVRGSGRGGSGSRHEPRAGGDRSPGEKHHGGDRQRSRDEPHIKEEPRHVKKEEPYIKEEERYDDRSRGEDRGRPSHDRGGGRSSGREGPPAELSHGEYLPPPPPLPPGGDRGQQAGGPRGPDEEDMPLPGPPKEAPNLGLSGKLAAETNKAEGGVVLKHQPPPDAAKPDKKWRLYVFKDGKMQEEPLYLHRNDHYLFGRDFHVADVVCAHPSISKQHAVLQFRKVPSKTGDQMTVRPYMMDLGTVNGTFLNGERIEAERFYELLLKDTLKFGMSTREYLLLHEEASEF